MATRYWNGAADTSYTNTANWDGATAPVAADSVIIRADAVNGIAGSDQSATALASFMIQFGCTIDIGSSGAPLIIACDDFLAAPTGGNQWFALQDGTAAGLATTVDIRGGLVSSSPTTEGLHIKSNTTDTLSPCRVHSGQANFDEDCNIPVLDVLGGNAYINDADGLTTVNCTGGIVYNAADDAITTLNLAANVLYYHLEGAAAITTLNVWGGTLNYRSAATITTLNGRFGTITFADTTLRCTVTNCSLWSANLDLRNGIGTPTFTNVIARLGNGQVSGDINTTDAPTPSL